MIFKIFESLLVSDAQRILGHRFPTISMDLFRCSFGETVRLLHPFHEPFTDQSGARILQQFTFDQKKTKIAQVSCRFDLFI